MQAIQAVILEPAGCLAEFRAADFNEAARQLSRSPGTTYYWRVRPRVQGDGTQVRAARSDNAVIFFRRFHD